jgi:hypothetical protein
MRPSRTSNSGPALDVAFSRMSHAGLPNSRAIRAKSMTMSLRSPTARRMLVVLTGRPSSEMTRNGMLWLRLSGLVRKDW